MMPSAPSQKTLTSTRSKCLQSLPTHCPHCWVPCRKTPPRLAALRLWPRPSAINNLKGADLVDGGKILSHIFGGDLNNVLEGISKKSGVVSGLVSKIMASMAPSLLALLGKGQQSGGVNAGNLAGMLGTILGATQGKSNSGLGSILGGLGKIFGR